MNLAAIPRHSPYRATTVWTMHRRLLPVLIASGILLAVPAVAKTPPANVKLRPSAPYVDDDLKVSFTSPGALKSGYSYNVTLTGCASSVASKSVKPPRRAKQRITVTLRPTDQIVDSAPEWCQGRAQVRITRAKGDRLHKVIAVRQFRFRAKP